MTLNVTVYTKPGCQPCRGTKRLLDKLGIEYDEIDFTQDPEALTFVRSLGHQEAPVVYVDDMTHWSGYKPDLIRSLA